MKIRLGQSLVIDRQDIRFETARSSGPGGQNVNKVSTKVTLCFDLQGTQTLDAGQKRTLRRKLGTRISRMGILRVTSRKYRSQPANKKAALRRFEELLTEALKPAKKRIATRVRRGGRREAHPAKERARPSQARPAPRRGG